MATPNQQSIERGECDLMSKERKIRNWVRSLMMKHELGTITNQLMELIVPSEEIDKVELTIELTASRESQEEEQVLKTGARMNMTTADNCLRISAPSNGSARPWRNKICR